MRPLSRFAPITPWLGLLLGLFVCSLPLMAMAVEFRPPRRGVPGRREGGGTRDPYACVQGNPARLTAIMPETNLGLTTAAHPRFFWYSPKTRAKFAEFTLVKANATTPVDKSPVYTATFSITGAPGVTSLNIPDAIFPLVIGQDYRWSLALICNPNNREQDIKVEGGVQRVTPNADLANKLATATPGDRPLLYANNGLWFDTLTTLAELRCANPQDASLVDSWAQLMKSVKLGAIANQAIVQQCGE